MIKIEQQPGTSLTEMIAKSIRVARTTQGMTVQQLADASGVSASTLNNIDAGRTFPSTDTLGKIFGVLGVRVELNIE